MVETTQLAIESIGKTGSLAILRGDTLLWKRPLSPELRVASQLAVHLDEALTWCSKGGHSLHWVSVAAGPGSFTGIRIAITTAKSVAYALSIPVVAVGSLAAVASVIGQSVDFASENILVGLNAYRGQVFAADFRRDELMAGEADSDAGWIKLANRAEVITREQWGQRLSRLSPGETQRVAGGDEILFAPDQMDLFTPRSDCDAVGVGTLAARMYKECGDRIFQDALQLNPTYLKLSAAEEKAVSR